MPTAIETIIQIHRHGTQVANDSLRIIPDNFPAGQHIPQGDINIFRLPQVPKSAASVESVAQLAPGTSRGSRHCIKAEDLGKCEFLKLPNPNPLQGPVIVFHDSVTITHPEHGDQLWPACVVAITYQRRYADEIRRIQD